MCYLRRTIPGVISQDYDVSEIQCTFSGIGDGKNRDSIAAKLKKPEGFRGSPLFADDRNADPLTDLQCQIRPDHNDATELTYNLLITDFNRCGVLKRNGFVHVRIWFPQFPGVVMMSDQELILMCKPPEPTVIENKAAGFAGSFPHGARVSGVVEETPGHLEYEVALYKEAPARISTNTTSELPVDQAVPIGTKLQLRARINPDSAWKYVKLMEVTVSPDPDDPHKAGSVALVKDGCRNRDFASIIPHQPARYRNSFNEVFLDFEAFLLSSMRERSTLWIHSQIKACMDAGDCQPEFCLDLFEPSGNGKRRKRETDISRSSRKTINSTNSTKFQDNLEYTVLMPGDFFQKTYNGEESCSTLLYITSFLGIILFISALIMCYLATRLHGFINKQQPSMIDHILTRTQKYQNPTEKSCYTGRATVQ
ncbi:conserved hypothetical protein [Pediculus humanus corporis]|uniref:ZP domain-containing protein n=1 Tax=Pediculus humanus subsp. corporis TaxID=121224 RepID=E0VAT5_PEDHC|nr:uncharacterized protein Phum_PHUM044520 [Pediculus humanus corporis]EEB10491.1 conserved hypothetical protein [Pediculus humanus corporis]